MAQMIADAVAQSGSQFMEFLSRLLPRIVTTAAIILVGWLIAVAGRAIVRLLLRGLRFNTGAERLGVARPLEAAGLPHAEALAGAAVFWLIWIGFLLSAVDVLAFRTLQGLLAAFTDLVPRLLVAIVILVLGFVFSNFAARATLLAAINARIPSPRLLSGAIRGLILVLVGAMALEQIAVARTVVLTAFAIAFGVLMLGMAIAFGVAGSDIARRILEQQFPPRRQSDADEISHL